MRHPAASPAKSVHLPTDSNGHEVANLADLLADELERVAGVGPAKRSLEGWSTTVVNTRTEPDDGAGPSTRSLQGSATHWGIRRTELATRVELASFVNTNHDASTRGDQR